MTQLSRAENATLYDAKHPFTAITTITDICDLDSLFEPRADSVQLTLSRFSAEARCFKTRGISVLNIRSRAGYQSRLRIAPSHAVFVYARGERGFLTGARNCAPMRDMVVAREAQIELRTTGASDLVWIDVDLYAYPELAAFVPQATQWLLLTSADKNVHTQVDMLVEALVANAARRAARPAEGANIERQLIVRAGDALRRLSAKPGPTKREKNRQDLASRVERFMWDNIEEHITLARICRSIGCRTRSAIYCFKDLFGEGPVTYLKIRRLCAVHRRLKEKNLNLRIIDVAADFGFWHMGHFSADYKRMFGTTASETVSAARHERALARSIEPLTVAAHGTAPIEHMEYGLL